MRTSTLASHLLALFILFLIVYDQVLIFLLKRNPDSATRLRTYWRIMGGLWLGTAAAFGIMGRGLWSVRLSPAEETWIPGHGMIAGIVIGMVIGSVAAMLAPVLMMRNPKAAAAITGRLGKLRYMLPQTPQERFWWALLSITAGVCEECIFRSFLFQYLHVSPWRLGMVTALLLACVLFALGHLYQGVKAAAATGVLGALLFVFFLATGNLLLPISLHALADLRVLLLIPRAGVIRESLS